MSGPQTPRRRLRRRAFQVLYGFAFDPPGSGRTPQKAVWDAPRERGAGTSGNSVPVADMVSGAWARREELDRIIEGYSQNWKVGRIAKVELTILRLALFEILHVEDMPLRVVINEAVELAKEFGDENSPAFVNGILDGVAQAVAMGRFDMKKDFARKEAEALP